MDHPMNAEPIFLLVELDLLRGILLETKQFFSLNLVSSIRRRWGSDGC
jgi:hypothetical protein